MNYYKQITLPSHDLLNPAGGICSHFLLHRLDRNETTAFLRGIHAGCWSPDGRRLVLGTMSGKFLKYEVVIISLQLCFTIVLGD